MTKFDSLLRRLEGVTATDGGRAEAVLRRITAHAVDGEPLDVAATVADVDECTGLAILRHVQIHGELHTRRGLPWGPSDPDARAEALRQLSENWPSEWTADALDRALVIARRIFVRPAVTT